MTAATLATAAPATTALPPEIVAAFARAKIAPDALAVVLADAQSDVRSESSRLSNVRLDHRGQVSMAPASVMKLVTTYAGLDILGPAFVWNTPVYIDGPVQGGVLKGNLYIQGQGDPKLVLERLWLLLRRVEGMGIRSIQGDIVLDTSALNVPEQDPGAFDGEPLRPYNAAPDALLLNFRALVFTFTPDQAGNVASVQTDPPLAGVQTQSTVPLLAGDCADYRTTLKADFSDPTRVRFAGGYPASCGERVWPVAYADPKSYALRAVLGLWQDMGGKLAGSVRLGHVPTTIAAAKPAFSVTSAPLADIIRDINKYSNNVMAQQLFLTLGRNDFTAPDNTEPTDSAIDTPTPSTDAGLAQGSFAASRAVVQRWWKARIGTEDAPVIDNGSGLSRQERVTAAGLAHLLQAAYASPLMPELMASLPLSGVDGTLRRMKPRTSGSAHLKTGTLGNVLARAGYVDAPNGKRWILVAILNHPSAGSEAAHQAMDRLVEWAMRVR